MLRKLSLSLTFLTVTGFITLLFSSCTKDHDNGTPDGGNVPMSIEFDNIAGGQNLFLNTVNYTNASGETFNVSVLKYFISNISLRKTDGTQFVLNQDSSYFLIDESDPETHEAEFDIPAGDYDQVSFMIGVDSLRSTMDAAHRTGVLDQAARTDDGMYWDANSGYVFLKMEGIAPAAPVDVNGEHKFRYDIGGFGGNTSHTINNLHMVTLDLRANGILQPRPGREANVHLMVDVLKIFTGANNVSIAQHPLIMFDDYSVNVATNYAAMFRHDHTEN